MEACTQNFCVQAFLFAEIAKFNNEFSLFIMEILRYEIGILWVACFVLEFGCELGFRAGADD